MINTKLDISGMSCEGCVRSLNIALKNLGVNVNETKIGFVDFSFDENILTIDIIKKEIEEVGFKVEDKK